MVDNRSAGFYGVGGAFNFKGGDISGTAARTQDDKMGQGGEYFQQGEQEDDQNQRPNEYFTDRSAQLRATLNSLAMMNVASVINTKKRIAVLDDELKIIDEETPEDEDRDEEFLNDYDEEDEQNEEDNEYY